ncbi:MAG: hypothetical protein H0U27_08375 [Nitrosopumilus sp.]|nr:hypothetical protein [Nitrosopumilus sp.]
MIVKKNEKVGEKIKESDHSDVELEAKKNKVNTNTIQHFPPYEATIEEYQGNTFTYHSISKMKQYKNLSFDEIRWAQMEKIPNKKEGKERKIYSSSESEYENRSTIASNRSVRRVNDLYHKSGQS